MQHQQLQLQQPVTIAAENIPQHRHIAAGRSRVRLVLERVGHGKWHLDHGTVDKPSQSYSQKAGAQAKAVGRNKILSHFLGTERNRDLQEARLVWQMQMMERNCVVGAGMRKAALTAFLSI